MTRECRQCGTTHSEPTPLCKRCVAKGQAHLEWFGPMLGAKNSALRRNFDGIGWGRLISP